MHFSNSLPPSYVVVNPPPIRKNKDLIAKADASRRKNEFLQTHYQENHVTNKQLRRMKKKGRKKASKRQKAQKQQSNLRKFRAKVSLEKKEYIKAKADHLRANQTSAERKLGNRLKSLGFLPQVVIYPYIADFCHAKLPFIVEADGQHHQNSPEQVEHDRKRDRYFKRRGFQVLRFSNKRIFKDLNSVISTVREEVWKAKLVPPFAQAQPAY